MEIHEVTNNHTIAHFFAGWEETMIWFCLQGCMGRAYADNPDTPRSAAILKDREIVSGASSYSGYRGGIEIETDTKADERRRGLAKACGAQLIWECRRRGLYPSWDAHAKASLALAEQLGYQFNREYPVYEVSEA